MRKKSAAKHEAKFRYELRTPPRKGMCGSIRGGGDLLRPLIPGEPTPPPLHTHIYEGGMGLGGYVPLWLAGWDAWDPPFYKLGLADMAVRPREKCRPSFHRQKYPSLDLACGRFRHYRSPLHPTAVCCWIVSRPWNLSLNEGMAPSDCALQIELKGESLALCTQSAATCCHTYPSSPLCPPCVNPVAHPTAPQHFSSLNSRVQCIAVFHMFTCLSVFQMFTVHFWDLVWGLEFGVQKSRGNFNALGVCQKPFQGQTPL